MRSSWSLTAPMRPRNSGSSSGARRAVLLSGRERPTAGLGVLVTLAIVLLLVLSERFRDPAGPAAPDWGPVLADAHRLITFSVSVTRFLFIRPKL